MKPTFLTKKQREEQALERLNAKRSEEDVKKKVRFDSIPIVHIIPRLTEEEKAHKRRQ